MHNMWHNPQRHPKMKNKKKLQGINSPNEANKPPRLRDWHSNHWALVTAMFIPFVTDNQISEYWYSDERNVIILYKYILYKFLTLQQFVKHVDLKKNVLLCVYRTLFDVKIHCKYVLCMKI